MTGRSGDLVVVMDSSLWSGKSGEAVMNCLAAPQEGLPQDEPLFNVIRVRKNEFSNIFRTTRNILLIGFSEKNEKEKFALNQELWAKDQLVMTILAHDDRSIASILKKNCVGITSRYRQEEYTRAQRTFAELKDQKIAAEIKELTGLDLDFPNDYKISTKSEVGIWLRREMTHQGHQISMGFVIHRENYTSEEQFSAQNLMNNATAMARMVPGPIQGSFMKLYEEFAPVEQSFERNGKYVNEIRGLWNMENAFMGGPFVCFAFLDKNREQLYFLYGYVFAPKFDKREYLREIESICLSALKPDAGDK